MTLPNVLLIFDKPWISYLTDGKPPLAAYSHDQMLFQLGHESLRKGFSVYLESSHETKGTGDCWRVTQFFPILKMEKCDISKRPAPDLVALAYPQSLALRKLYPNAKIVGMIPAMNFLEHPQKPSTGWVYGYLEAARTQVDYYITQNARMAELLRCLFRFTARTELREHILACPLGIIEEQRRAIPPREETRKEMSLKEGELAFINAGGPWSWTDYNTFLEAFCRVVRSGMAHIKFYVMGFKQPENPDHNESVDAVKATIAANKDLIGKNLMVYEDWYDAAEKAFRFTCAADVGVNVSKDSAENWQSYRVRFLDYMKAGIPVIHTTGDDLSAHEGAGAVYPVTAGDIPSYETAIRLAASDHNMRARKARAIQECARAFDSRNTYGKAIDRLLSLPRRDFSNPHEVFDPPLLTPPRPEPSQWTACAALDLGKKTWEYVEGWRDGEGPIQHAIPSLAAGDDPMSLGFDLTLMEPITASWAEIIQIGASPEKARSTIYAVAADEDFFRLVIRIFDADGRSQNYVSENVPIGKAVSCALRFRPEDASLDLSLNGKATRGEKLRPWRWIATDSLWLGSRRLPGGLDRVWLGQ